MTKPIILFDPFGIQSEYQDKTFFKKPGDFLHTLHKHFTELGFEVHTIDIGPIDCARAIVYLGWPARHFLDQAARVGQSQQQILFLFEPPVVDPNSYDNRNHHQFGKVFTYVDSLIDNKKYYKFLFPQLDPGALPPKEVPFGERRLLTLMNANKRPHPAFQKFKKRFPENKLFQIRELYSDRVKAITYFEKSEGDGFDFYGPGWRKRGGFLKFYQSGHPCYRGTVDNKIATLSKYKFVMCYENATDLPGYITEKIFDCFKARVVPIYWGAPNVETYIPTECFIDRRRFKSLPELHKFLLSIDLTKYQSYIHAIEKFINSATIQPWSYYAFAQNLSLHIGLTH